MMNSRKDWERDYRTIYDMFWENPRCPDSVIATILGARIAATRLEMAYGSGYIVGPEIRKKSYKNLREYMYLINCDDPELLYMELREDPNIIYHAKTIGFCNMWIIASNRIRIGGKIISDGFRSDYYVPYAPNHSWKNAIEIMRKKIMNFNPETYNPQGIIQTHFDETIDWDSEDELLYRYFKCDLRGQYTPIIKDLRIAKDKADSFLGRLNETCTIHTHYYPKTLPMYDSYLLMIDTDYEDFVIDLFSKLPSSVSFFKVSNRLFISAYVPWRYIRDSDLQISASEYSIPFLLIELKRKGIVKSKDYEIVEYSKRKDI
jgi:hypothetical protein